MIFLVWNLLYYLQRIIVKNATKNFNEDACVLNKYDETHLCESLL